MSYHEEVLKKVENKDWPEFKRRLFLSQLDDLAEKMYSEKTVSGYLASFLVYQQLCEEWVKLLIECSDFRMQCALFPQEIRPRLIERKTFGQLIVELESGVCDDEIRTFIKLCKDLNNLRIKMVHKITSKDTIKDIGKQARQGKGLYDRAYTVFDSIRDRYHMTFSDYISDEMRELL